MRISIANDHNGVKIKNELKEYICKLGHDLIDFGSNEGEDADYPLYAYQVGNSVASLDTHLGILICGTGIGMSIACNKVKGIRCAKVSSIEEAKLSKQHNNANVIAISSKTPIWKLKKIIKTFIETPFSNEERHIRRNSLIDDYND